MKKLMIALILPILILNSCTTIDVYFCPQDSCSQKVIAELQGAEHSVLFMTYSFTDIEIADTLIKKSKSVIIKGIMESQRINSRDNVYYYLTENNISVFLDKNPAIMHNKVFIIDGKTVITGSFNPTKNGNENNNENIVIIKDKRIAKKYMNEFIHLTNSQN